MPIMSFDDVWHHLVSKASEKEPFIKHLSRLSPQFADFLGIPVACSSLLFPSFLGVAIRRKI